VEAPAFAAIDFETADYGRDSACDIAIVHVVGGRIARRFRHLIRPPRKDFVFSYLHGITWRDVANQLSFGELWPLLRSELDAAPFLVAHNAAFDRSVLSACCHSSGVVAPTYDFECSMRLARSVWSIYPTKLSHVCRYLGIPLQHHQATSDAEACARIVLQAMKDGGLSHRRGIAGPGHRPTPRHGLPRD
jgi:DNA polymerase-3 subunit epsilon